MAQRLKKIEGLPPTQDRTALPATASTTIYFGAVKIRNWLVAGAEQVLTYPRAAVKLLNGTTPAQATYIHRDGLGSVRALTNFPASSLNSRLNLRLSMQISDPVETLYLGVHQTGSRPMRPLLSAGSEAVD